MATSVNGIGLAADCARQVLEDWIDDFEYQRPAALKAWQLLAVVDDVLDSVGRCGPVDDELLLLARHAIRQEMFFGGAPQSRLPYLAVIAVANLIELQRESRERKEVTA